jgi:hypothetical protein
MSANISPRDLQTLSEYLDDQLSAREKAQLEARLHKSAELREELTGLRQTRLMLRSLPKRRAPRNFTVNPAAAPAHSGRRVFPTFGFATALAGLVLVAAFIGQALLPANLAAVPEAAPAAAAEKVLAPAAVDQANREPIIILWGTPTPVPGIGGGGYGGGGEGPVGGGDGSVEAIAPTIDPATGLVNGTPTLPPRVMTGIGGGSQPTPSTPGAEVGLENSTATSALRVIEPATATPAAVAQADNAGASGLIFGVQKAQAYATPTPAGLLAAVAVSGQNQAAPVLPWRTLQILAAIIFIPTVLAAFYFYRKERH